MYYLLPTIYAAFVGLVLFLSGLPAFHPKAARIDARNIVAFASGVVTAVMFEMIPEADVSNNCPFLGIGFFVFYLRKTFSGIISKLPSMSGNLLDILPLGLLLFSGDSLALIFKDSMSLPGA